MGRKQGDNNFSNYVGYQAFSSDEPTHRINNTNWYLKFEDNKTWLLFECRKMFQTDA